MRYVSRKRLWYFLFILWGAGLTVSYYAIPQQPVNPAEKQAAVSDYAGSEACATCHEDLYQKFRKNPHQILETHPKKGWQKKSCEACHGAGAQHVESAAIEQIVSFNKIPANQITQRCLNCHGRMDDHAGFASGLHGRNQVSCTDCHRIHESEQSVHLWAVRSDQLCVRCHRENLAAFNKPFRHKLHEGAINCVDCHQPHGGLNPKQVNLFHGQETACMKCHSDKRGPFVFEHPSMKLEGCMACHEPHGSVNAKMLTRSSVKQLCLECHSMSQGTLAPQPASFHDLRSPQYQNCTNCHVRIHGSNVSQYLLR